MSEAAPIRTPTTPSTSTPFGGENSSVNVSPNIVVGTRVLGAATAIMVILGFIFCLVRGSGNGMYYLLACNLIISTFVAVVNAWWYRMGDLGADKHWYMWVLCCVIIFQCIATDIFVFHDKSQAKIVSTTTVMPTTSETSTVL